MRIYIFHHARYFLIVKFEYKQTIQFFYAMKHICIVCRPFTVCGSDWKFKVHIPASQLWITCDVHTRATAMMQAVHIPHVSV